MKRFIPKMEADLIKVIDKNFNAFNECTEEKALELDVCSIIDNTQVMSIVAKSEEFKRVISRFVFIKDCVDIPLDYKDVGCSRFSVDYMKIALNIFGVFSKYADKCEQLGKFDVVDISLSTDYPIRFENEHMKFIIAPRIKE